jgi:glycosyltransferase involved in cell wall biosynthesis
LRSQPTAPAARPTVSVITPAYNVAPYLGACIESVLNQTFRDFELIVVDDGSTDRTAEVVASYASRDPRIRGFSGPNRGVSHARNVAMRHARGRYFAFIDGDDEWDSRFLETLVGVLERQPACALVTGNAINLGGGRLDGRPVRPWPADPHEVTFQGIVEDEGVVFIMTVFRREVYDTIGGMNERLHRSEDYEFWLRATAAGFRMITCPEPLGRYRRRENSLTTDNSGMFESMMQVLASARGFRQRARAEELGAIDRQLAKLDADFLLSKGKSALLRRQFGEARSHFWELYRRGKGRSFGAIAIGLRLAPHATLYLYQRRLARLNAPIARNEPAVSRT